MSRSNRGRCATPRCSRNRNDKVSLGHNNILRSNTEMAKRLSACTSADMPSMPIGDPITPKEAEDIAYTTRPYVLRTVKLVEDYFMAKDNGKPSPIPEAHIWFHMLIYKEYKEGVDRLARISYQRWLLSNEEAIEQHRRKRSRKLRQSRCRVASSERASKKRKSE